MMRSLHEVLYKCLNRNIRLVLLFCLRHNLYWLTLLPSRSPSCWRWFEGNHGYVDWLSKNRHPIWPADNFEVVGIFSEHMYLFFGVEPDFNYILAGLSHHPFHPIVQSFNVHLITHVDSLSLASPVIHRPSELLAALVVGLPLLFPHERVIDMAHQPVQGGIQLMEGLGYVGAAVRAAPVVLRFDLLDAPEAEGVAAGQGDRVNHQLEADRALVGFDPRDHCQVTGLAPIVQGLQFALSGGLPVLVVEPPPPEPALADSVQRLSLGAGSCLVALVLLRRASPASLDWRVLLHHETFIRLINQHYHVKTLL